MDYFYFGVIPTTLVILVFILVVVRVVMSFLFHFFFTRRYQDAGRERDRWRGARAARGWLLWKRIPQSRAGRRRGDVGVETTAAAVRESRRLGNNSSDSATVLYTRPSNYTRRRGPESYSELENRKKENDTNQNDGTTS